MSPNRTLFHRRSVTLSLLALAISILAAGPWTDIFFARSHYLEPNPLYVLLAVTLLVVSITINFQALLNLMVDVNRGYSPQRCQVASVILFFAFSITVILAVGLFAIISD